MPLSLLEPKLFPNKKWKTSSTSLLRASLKVRLVQPRASSPSPGLFLLYWFLQLFDETKKWDAFCHQIFFLFELKRLDDSWQEKSKTNRIRRRCIFRSEGFVGSDLSTSIDGCLITDQLFLCLETPLIRKVACRHLTTNLKVVRYDSAQW